MSVGEGEEVVLGLARKELRCTLFCRVEWKDYPAKDLCISMTSEEASFSIQKLLLEFVSSAKGHEGQTKRTS